MSTASRADRLLRPVVLARPIRLVDPNSWVTHIPFAFWIVDALRPRIVVELGTQSGNSYAALVQAVQALNLETACYAVDTWRGDAQAGYYGEEVFAEWSAFHDRYFTGCSRLMRMSFDEARAHFSDGSVDLLHVDGLHTLEAVRHDFDTWRGALSARGVVLFHDINVREDEFGAWRFWEEVHNRYPSFTFTHGHGLGVLAVGTEARSGVRWLTDLCARSEATASVRRYFHELGDRLRLQLQVDSLTRTRENDAQRLRELQTPSAAAERGELIEHLETLRLQLEASRHEGVALAAEGRELGDQVRILLSKAEVAEQELAQARQQLTEALEESQGLAMERDSLSRQLHDLELAHAESATVATARLNRLEASIASLEGRHWQAQSEAIRQETARRAVDVAGSQRAEAVSRTRALSRALRRLRQADLPPEFARHHPLRFARGAIRLRHREFRLQVAQLAESGLFDAAFYRRHIGCDGNSSVVARFLLYGDRAHEQPHPLFDPKWYVSQHSALVADAPPLLHYLRAGGRAPLRPHPLFDGGYYVQQWPADTRLGPTPLSHFLAYGVLGAASPHPLFDVTYYLGQQPRLPEATTNPLLHYLATARSDSLDPHPVFSTRYYLESNPDLGSENPLEHFVRIGAREGRSPHPMFDIGYYWQQRPDVRKSGVNALLHYLETGWTEGVDPHPGFDTSYYLQQIAGLEASGLNPLLHFLRWGIHEGVRPHPSVSRLRRITDKRLAVNR